MMLSKTCKYAVRSVIYMAANYNENQKCGIKVLAEELQIPAPFLSKILQKLARFNVLVSNKGPNGGFALAAPPDKISLYRVVEIIDGKELFESCALSDDTCDGRREASHVCALHDSYSDIRKQLILTFKEKMISDLLSEADGFPGNMKF
ncbi:Rrf2 family transcriptional regulator [Prolixibacter sp. SD074]|uniref:RrF2 family transcriptional regulator n=1 Tax=Prolixibacter sp. SD074 TaxID=2652391 RepID=UPI00128339FB|nr:Rrf2 family transcriptional regulator [Prolixibacter sp. SD074]GET30443.1 Rrf2 family transcriptional regulator [Prolixibacter sp. SD074]